MLHHTNVLKKICAAVFFAVVFISCASKPAPNYLDPQNTGDDDLALQVEDVPEGVRISFENIPADTTMLFINIYKDEFAPTQWADAFAAVLGPQLDELKKTKQLVFPFAEKGQLYAISLDVARDNGDNAREVINFQTQNGNNVTNNVELLLNDEQTSVTLSEEPVFSLPVEFEERKYEYVLLFFPDDYSSISSGIYSGNDLSCAFSPELVNHIRKNSPEIKGTFPAYVAAVCNINYNGVSWMLKIAQTKDFELEL